ncbi:MAG TPA: extracellular solute-binding protein [Chloroflexota bacterium]|nr:extracellular solute-binding protein [Chloroflexota bacterium]
MKRRTLLGRSALTASAAGLAACGVPGAQSGPPAGLKDQTATVRYMTWYGADRLPTTQAWIKAYNEEFPKVKVEIEELVLADVPVKFQAQLAGGTPPDLILADSHAQTKWFDSGAHLDMTQFLARDRINLDRDYALVGIEHWCGKVYFIPFFADSNAIFYNKTMLQQAGVKDPWADGKGDWTIEDLYSAAKAVTRDLNGDGLPDQYGLNAAFGISEAAPFTWTRGGDVADLQTMKYTVDSPIAMEGHKQLYDWLLKDRIIPSSADSTRVMSGITGLNIFSAGKVAFHMRAVNDVELFQRTVKDSFEWDCLPFPKMGNRQGVNLAAGTGHSIIKESKVPEHAWQLTRVISTDKGQEIMGTMLGLPALKSKQEVWLKARQAAGKSPAHPKVWLDVFTKPYGVHFRHHTTREVQAIYGQHMNPVRAGTAQLEPQLREANRLMNLELKYDPSCQPYKGIVHPIQPKK